MAWYLCARAIAASASNGLALRFNLSDTQQLLESLFQLFLVVLGLAALRAIERRLAPLSIALGLPGRSTARAEWALGAAIGWGIAVASILPMALIQALNVRLWTAPRAFELLALSLATLAVSTLAQALAVYGYGFQRLIETIGPIRATIVLALLSAIVTGFNPASAGTPIATRILVEILATILLALCWFRTHGLWLLWGLHFAWSASTAVLFGLPLAGDTAFSSVVDTRAVGHLWLTGGSYGPGAAFFSIVVLLAAIAVLVRTTGDYAWAYTHPPIIPAGYDVTIPPPAAHAAMEAAALTAAPINPASLVQILPAAPRTPTPRN
jgi:hypothetical protein